MDFDLNDFDETLPGPFEWDLKRLAASLEVAGRDRGFAAAEREAVVRACAASYRTAMAGFAGQSNLEIFYARMAEATEADDAQAARAAARVGKPLPPARIDDVRDRWSHRTRSIHRGRRVDSGQRPVGPVLEVRLLAVNTRARRSGCPIVRPPLPVGCDGAHRETLQSVRARALGRDRETGPGHVRVPLEARSVMRASAAGVRIESVHPERRSVDVTGRAVAR
jgi:hypothetical protein